MAEHHIGRGPGPWVVVGQVDAGIGSQPPADLTSGQPDLGDVDCEIGGYCFHLTFGQVGQVAIDDAAGQGPLAGRGRLLAQLVDLSQQATAGIKAGEAGRSYLADGAQSLLQFVRRAAGQGPDLFAEVARSNPC